MLLFPNMADAQQAYLERKFKCNDGWCQDIIQVRHLPARFPPFGPV